MRDLLKTDLKRILKDKLFLVVLILGGVFALITPLLYEALVLAFDFSADEAGMLIDAKTLFFSSFSLGNNFGLILPILLSVVLCKDFIYGTVRNKIISGKRRSEIFLSMFISGTVVIVGVMLAHALLTLIVSLLFFPYQEAEFTGRSLSYFLISLLLSLLIYVFVSALICFLSAFMKNVGLVIVLYVAVNFFFSIVGAIVSVAAVFSTNASETTRKILEILQKANLYTATHIGTGVEYSLSDVLCVLIPVIFGVSFCLLLGLRIFGKKDLK